MFACTRVHVCVYEHRHDGHDHSDDDAADGCNHGGHDDDRSGDGHVTIRFKTLLGGQ